RPSTAGRSTAPTTMRDQKLLIDLPAAEPPLATRVFGQGPAQMRLAELGPGRLHEDELCISELPEQEVGNPLVAGRTDQQVRVREIRLVERPAEGLLVDLLRRYPGPDEAP